jgi:hypothetical protein
MNSVPHCRVVDSGWEKGNWFVKLLKIADERLQHSQSGPERCVGEMNTRTLNQTAVVRSPLSAKDSSSLSDHDSS